MAITLKTARQIGLLREAGRIVAVAMEAVKQAIEPGITTAELDAIAEKVVRDMGAIPSYKGYRGSYGDHPPFPGTICVSINEEICHGLPSKRKLKAGDIVSVDIGSIYEGWCGDTCATFPVGEVSDEMKQLLEVTEKAMQIGIDACWPGKRLGDIGAAIQNYVEPFGYSLVRDWTGHGIGRERHEADPTIYHYGKAGTGAMMRPGMVFTIEPMVNIGGPRTKMLKDGWTVVTADGSRSAQFEHTIAIREDGVEILSKP
jgi:methionine aminopeptidase, type I